MKSKLNFKAVRQDERIFDMHSLGLWVSSFRITSPNVTRIKRQTKKNIRLKRTQLDVRDVHISMQFEENSMVDFDEKKHKIYEIFFSDKPIKIVRDITPDKHILVYQEGYFDIENITATDGEFDLLLTMYDPLFGLEKTITLTTSNQTHQITGQAETPWSLEITFTTNTNRFEAWFGDNYLQLNHTFVAGDKLLIDYVGRKVLLNGNDMRRTVSMSSNFAELDVGNVVVRATHSAVLKYDERYY